MPAPRPRRDGTSAGTSLYDFAVRGMGGTSSERLHGAARARGVHDESTPPTSLEQQARGHAAKKHEHDGVGRSSAPGAGRPTLTQSRPPPYDVLVTARPTAGSSHAMARAWREER